jgi:hypothetical protein
MTATGSQHALHAEGCLFCRRHDGGFASREHIFSEALGNLHQKVLAPGVVCDRCNNGPLAVGDGELVRFEPIMMLRAERGLATKTGKAVTASFSNATLWYGAPGQLNVESNSRKTTRKMGVDGGELELLGRPITPKRARLIVRSVWKSTLELLYLDVGPRVAFHEVFDDARDAILDDHCTGWAMLDRDCATTPCVELEYERAVVGGRRAMPVTMNIFGVVMRTDLLRRDLATDVVRPAWPHNLWEFSRGPACGWDP